jgi:YVTN family beta-propeller protein
MMRLLPRLATGRLVLIPLAILAVAVSGKAVASELSEPPDPPAHVTVPGGIGSTTPVAPALPTSRPATTALPRNIYAGAGRGDWSPMVKRVPERVYVPSSQGSSIDVIDPRTFRVIGHYSVGAEPQHITPSWNLRWLYVDNTYSNSLSVVDPRTGRPTGRVIPVTDPYNLYFTLDGTKAIVVAERYRRLDFRDSHTWKLLKSVPIPCSGPDHLDFSADGRILLVSCEFSGEVVRVAVPPMRVIGTLRVGGLPVDVRLSPDGRTFFVANQGLNGVTLVSARTFRITGFLHTGSGAHGLAVSRDARWLYVSNRTDGSISVIRAQHPRVVATWHVGGSPDMMQVSPDGRELWVSNRFSSSVSVISTRSGHVLHRTAVGPSPHGLAFFPQPGRYSIGHNGVYR